MLQFSWPNLANITSILSCLNSLLHFNILKSFLNIAVHVIPFFISLQLCYAIDHCISRKCKQFFPSYREGRPNLVTRDYNRNPITNNSTTRDGRQNSSKSRLHRSSVYESAMGSMRELNRISVSRSSRVSFRTDNGDLQMSEHSESVSRSIAVE